jgi:hypothetical protein
MERNELTCTSTLVNPQILVVSCSVKSVGYRSVHDNYNWKQSENIQLHITSIHDKFLTTLGMILNLHKVTEKRELALQQVLHNHFSIHRVDLSRFLTRLDSPGRALA